MGWRLLLALLSAWLVAGLGCGPSGPTEQTKPLREMRPRMPTPDGRGK